ncbi:MAG TPA: hypothetical protein PKZ75_14465 [Bacteroidia bacterium]|nr:hypothetical protein [Bacteroidia bacterium]
MIEVSCANDNLMTLLTVLIALLTLSQTVIQVKAFRRDYLFVTD